MLTFASVDAGESKPAPADLAFFESRIRPVLVDKCYPCHSAEAAANKKLKGGLLLDSRESVLRGGDNGPVLVPGRPDQSVLIKAMRWQDHEKMPPKEQLPKAVVDDFATWIAKGAADPREGKAAPAGAPVDLAAARTHWAYRPVVAPKPPAVRDVKWPTDDLDRFVLARIEAAGLAAAEPATRYELLRRASYAITGLPPNAEQVDAFLADTTPDAFAKVVDRLLASPGFGAHWASHWLDGMRYNPARWPDIGFYRDWLVRALDADVPYDRLVVMQIAGDLLPATDPRERDDNMIAAQALQLSNRECDPIEGIMQVVGEQFLASTLTCAKCHNHKFDPFTQTDYYGMAGVFTSSRIGKPKAAGADKKSAQAVELAGRPGTVIYPIRDGVVADTNLLFRGEKDKKGPVVPRRFPVVLAGENQTPIGSRTKQSGRLELARWIGSPENPLAARVMANRVWMHVIGLPIVGTPNDFGLVGQAPLDQALLDHLAVRLVSGGWSIKKLVRAIVLSSTFRQSSRPPAETRTKDLDNERFTRIPLRRLTYEEILDSLLVLGEGLLPGFPPQPTPRDQPGVSLDGKVKGPAYRALFHTSVKYVGMFDGRHDDVLTDRRDSSVTATQSGFFIASPVVAGIADTVAKRIAAKAKDPAGQVRLAYRACYGRDPTGDEATRGAAQLNTGKTPLALFCQALIAANEFVYVR